MHTNQLLDSTQTKQQQICRKAGRGVGLLLLEYYILRSNGTHKILQKYKHRKRTKQERHIYTWFTQFGLRPPRTASPSFSIIQQNEETQPTAKPL